MKKKLTIFFIIILSLSGLFSEDYFQMGSFKDGLAIVTHNNKFGFIDENAKIVVPIIYDNVEEFGKLLDGLAKVTLNKKGKYGDYSKFGFIDKSGNIILSIEYDRIEVFEDGLFKIGATYLDENPTGSSNYFYGLIDKSGKTIVPAEYKWDIYNFKDGLARVKVEKDSSSKYGFIDRSGKVVIPIIYSYAGDFENGLAAVHIDGKPGIGFIDTSEKIVIPAIFSDYVKYSKGELIVVNLKDKYGLFNKIGKMLIPIEYDNIRIYEETSRDDEGEYEDELIQIELEKDCKIKYGFIDKTGRELIPIKYDALYSCNKEYGASNNSRNNYRVMFQNGMIRAKLDGKYGIVNKTGKEVVPLIYDCIDNFGERFPNGFSKITLNNKYGVVDKTGKITVPVIYDEFEVLFTGNIFNPRSVTILESLVVKTNNKYGVINVKTGKIVVPIEYNSLKGVNNRLNEINKNNKK